jgi:hypothetical protein
MYSLDGIDMHAYSLLHPPCQSCNTNNRDRGSLAQRSVRRESEETLKVTREYRTGSREKTHWGDLDIDIVKEAPHRIYFGFFPVSAYSKGGNVDYPSLRPVPTIRGLTRHSYRRVCREGGGTIH